MPPENPAEEGGTVRIVVADDQAVIRAALTSLLHTRPDFSVVGQAADGAQAVDLATHCAPHVVLMDIRMPHMDGLEATRRIIQGPSAPRVVVLTTYDLDEYLYDALRAGASGFLLKHAPPEELLLGVRAAADGGALLSPTITRRLLRTFTPPTPRATRTSAALGRLTAREREVFQLLVHGSSNAEIAELLFVSPSTVKTHVNRMLAKLGLRDRVHAVLYAYRNGLLDPGDTPSTPGAPR